MGQALKEILEIVEEGIIVTDSPKLSSEFFNLGVVSINGDLLKLISMRNLSRLVSIIINEKLISEKYKTKTLLLDRYNKGNIQTICVKYQEDLNDIDKEKIKLTEEELLIYEGYNSIQKKTAIKMCIELECYILGGIYAKGSKELLNSFLNKEDISLEIREIAEKIKEKM